MRRLVPLLTLGAACAPAPEPACWEPPVSLEPWEPPLQSPVWLPADRHLPRIWYFDDDGDGVGGWPWYDDTAPQPGMVAFSGDCDDWDPAIAPDEVEACDGKDNDCDGLIDEGLGACVARRLEPTADFQPCALRVPDPELALALKPHAAHRGGFGTGSPHTAPWPPVAYDAPKLAQDPAIATWLHHDHVFTRPGPFGYPTRGARPDWEAWSEAVRPAVHLGWTGLWAPPGLRVTTCVHDARELLPWVWSVDPELRRCPLPHFAYAERAGWFEVRTTKPPDSRLYEGDGGCPFPKPAQEPHFDEAAVRVEKLFAHWRVPRCGAVLELPLNVPHRSLFGPEGAGTTERLGQLAPQRWTPEERLHLLHQLAWEAHPDWHGTHELKRRAIPISLAVMARLTPEPTVRTCTWLAGKHPRDDLDDNARDRFFEIDWTMDPVSGALSFRSTPVSSY